MMSISTNHVKFSLLLFILSVLFISVVSASDINTTDNSIGLDEEDSSVSIDNSDKLSDDEIVITKQSPSIFINSSEVVTGESIEISLKNSNNESLANKNLTAIVNNNAHSLLTDDNGAAILKVDLPSKSYVLQVLFLGDDDYDEVNQTFDIDVLKIDTEITPKDTTVVYGNNFYSILNDMYGNKLDGEKITFKINGKTYTDTTNSKGSAGFEIKLLSGKYSLKISYAGDEYYKAVSKTITVTVLASTSVVIGNSILLTNGYLRIYLKSNEHSAIANKKVTVTIRGKTYTKKTNSEGIVVFKPYAGNGKLSVTVKFGGDGKSGDSSASKQVTGIKGDPKSPLKSKIPLRNGVPDVDYMTGSYVMADGDMSYTLTKAQYTKVIKRDSRCLYLNKKLSKFTFFKSKAEPKLNHIIKREKWNVIERAINTKIVKKNKNGYWPKEVTVSLNGKSYTYPEVRDVQNTGYTCGPTSCSMCSQALRNYYCEKYITSKGDTTPADGSSTKGLKKALEKCHFKCSIYYKSSFSKALKKLKKGGCALVFHTWGHYVSILDISKDGKKVLVGNPSGDYDHGSHGIPTKWLTVKYMKSCFNNYDTSGLIVKLKYSLSKSTKNKVNNFYSSMGTNWARQNVNERIPQI